jgi:hypothetical protein
MNTGQIISLLWKISALTGVVSAVGVWLLMRFTKPLDSYTEQLAKQLAKYQNLDKLVEETRRVTDAAETIKSSLSHDNWERQQRWATRLDAYRDATRAVNNYIFALNDLMACYTALEEVCIDDVQYNELIRSRNRLDIALRTAAIELSFATDTVTLVCSQTALNCLHEVLAAMPGPTISQLRDASKLAIAALRRFVYAARDDLGYEQVVWTSHLRLA